ncbi:hypothetical protein LguiA_013263 [Lonicera macranthoides]
MTRGFGLTALLAKAGETGAERAREEAEVLMEKDLSLLGLGLASSHPSNGVRKNSFTARASNPSSIDGGARESNYDSFEITTIQEEKSAEYIADEKQTALGDDHTTAGAVGWSFISYIEDFENISKIAWAKALCNHLMPNVVEVLDDISETEQKLLTEEFKEHKLLITEEVKEQNLPI